MQIARNEFIHVHEGIYIAFGGYEHSTKVVRQELKGDYVVLSSSECIDDANDPMGFNAPSSLKDIYNFDKIARRMGSRGKCIVFCAGLEPLLQYKMAFLVGCHLIMSLEVDFAQTASAFNRMNSFFRTFAWSVKLEPTVHSCWSALFRTKRMNWIDFEGHPNGPSMDMDEYSHYSW